MQNQIFDSLIIGGGVVGACVFNKLVRIGKKTLLLDKASDVATGASKANSGLVHAGYDPKPGSLKAVLNVKGSKLYPDIAKRLGVPFEVRGAIVVGNDQEKINALATRAKENGVHAEIFDEKKLQGFLPQLSKDCTIGLYAKDAAIVSPYLFTISLIEEGIINGGQVSLEEDLQSVTKEADVFVIKTNKGTYKAKHIINSAGMGFEEVSKLLGAEEHKIEFRRGEYFVFDQLTSVQVPCTVFPLPTEKGKGVLVTPTVDGNMLVGPTSEYCDGETKTTHEGLLSIKEKAKQMFADLDFRDAIRQFSGIRTICGHDFVIEKSKLQEGVINLAGICSPGLSAAPAIAERVLDLLGYENQEKENLLALKPYKMFKNMTRGAQEELLRENKDFAYVVCKCENITKGDIIAALDRLLKISSVDGVKRRTNAGMGRCQGGFCFSNVVKGICEARGIEMSEVKKENRGSEVVVGDLREVKS